jgi:hypothetical protein
MDLNYIYFFLYYLLLVHLPEQSTQRKRYALKHEKKNCNEIYCHVWFVMNQS